MNTTRFKELEDKSAEEILTWTLSQFGPRAGLASSFGMEDMVLIDMISKLEGNNLTILIDDPLSQDKINNIKMIFPKKHIDFNIGLKADIQDFLNIGFVDNPIPEEPDEPGPQTEELSSGMELSGEKRNKFAYLLENGILTQDELNNAISKARKTRVDIEVILLKELKLRRQDIGKSLEIFYKIPYTGYNSSITIPQQLFAGLNKNYLAKNHWVPIQVSAANLTIFTLDTGRLHEETYEIMEKVRTRYGLTIKTFFPDREAVEGLVRDKGFFSFRESVDNRKECCYIRKVEPLKRALAQLDAWVTGLRRDQNVTRTDVAKVDQDSDHDNLVKINPLADWTQQDVETYIEKHSVPVNSLHRKNYPSIGCAPCTRPINPGEDIRAGRWWWENPEHKECGLHR